MNILYIISAIMAVGGEELKSPNSYNSIEKIMEERKWDVRKKAKERDNKNKNKGKEQGRHARVLCGFCCLKILQWHLRFAGCPFCHYLIPHHPHFHASPSLSLSVWGSIYQCQWQFGIYHMDQCSMCAKHVKITLLKLINMKVGNQFSRDCFMLISNLD